MDVLSPARSEFTHCTFRTEKAAAFHLEGQIKLADSLLFHDKRVRELAPEDFGALANALAK